ncbi:glucose-1-phosphate adenylyltransferase family protein [Desulfopila inferna]|uniref:glucose-1-phosphate adenylyltransferase family protein n=1 Tax=Desulfopila inferna TaxID=468528 RepID=UPI001963FC2D|nr:sugar phosphate nucleotidyltransferase [Desulfopila inferna]MBM9605371.1 glucose-1-phosphate adenylyltransferase [Desulfopila inferna]
MLRPETLAMVLAGGRVDELTALTYYRPKSAVPFGGFGRVIDFALSNLMNSGIEQVALLSQYRSYSLINHIGTGAAWDMIGRYRHISILPPFLGTEATDWYRGSADAVFKNLDYVQYHNPEEILILSGDHIYKMDYQDMINYHRQKDADLTIAFIEVPLAEAHRFGVGSVIEDEDGRGGKVQKYWEKPQQPQSNWASLTVMCFRPQVLYDALKQNQQEESFEFGRDIIPQLLEHNYRVYGYKFCGYWGYTRTVEEYWQSNMDLLGENPVIDLEKWGFRTNLDHRGIRDFQPVLTGTDARVDNSLIYNGCIIDGEVRNSVIFPGVVVKKGAVIENSVIFFNNVINENCRLNKVVADVNNNYGRNVVIGAEPGSSAQKVTVIGWNNQVPLQTRIEEGATIYPAIQQSHWPSIVKYGEVLR